MSKNFLNYLLIFLVISLGLQIFFAEPKTNNQNPDQPISFSTSKKQYSVGKTLDLKITNQTDKKLIFPTKCPSQPFQVFKIEGTNSIPVQSRPAIKCENLSDPTLKNVVLNPNRTTTVRYTYWSHDLFNQIGEYKIGTKFTIEDKSYEIYSNSFEVVEKGFWGKFWLNIFYQPIYNVLIWIISVTPGYNLGLAIIMLTILIRIILFFPNQKALIAQKRLADVQPKLAAIKDKHKENQQKMAEETMKIWKEHKVNPASSCLPILIQFPILIALFYVIQDGLNPDKTWLLYDFISKFDLNSINTFFASLNLIEKNVIVLPIIVGALQFIQLKISMSKNTALNKQGKKNDDPNAMIQSTMLYIMPAMIAVFTASLPAGIGIYWGTSTLFGIIQQLIVNKSGTTNKTNKQDPKVIDLKESK